MKDTSKLDSSRECKEREENECSTPHTPHTLHTKEKRQPINIRLRRSLHDVFMKYCAGEDMTAGQFYEEAAILFIDLNPVIGSVFVFEKPERQTRNNGFEERMGELICIDELEDFVERIDKIKKSGVEIHRSNVKTLLKILKECNKISQRSQHLETLMNTAMNYFE